MAGLETSGVRGYYVTVAVYADNLNRSLMKRKAGFIHSIAGLLGDSASLVFLSHGNNFDSMI
jgi:hypothetical protein